MNYKSNKIFTKCCASILAVSNIFSGVSATPEEKPKKAEDNQLSISTNEFLVSILLASGFATLATLPLSKKIFSAKSTPAKFNGSKIGGYGFFNLADTTEDIEEVESMALALAKTDKKSNTITRERLLELCGAKSCKELLGGIKGKEISVNLNGNKYIYRVSCPGNPSSTKPGKEGGLLSKLKYCLFGSNNNSLSKLGWEKTLPFVINILTFDSNSHLNAHKKSTAVSVTVSERNAIESITKHTYSKIINDSLIDITREDELKEGFYPKESINTATMNVGYWEKISSSSSAASRPSEEVISGYGNGGFC